MAEPIFDETTERVYEQLPQHYRDRDILQNYQFKKYIAGLVSSQNTVNTIVDRLSFTPLDSGGTPDDTSDLVNPYTADANWLKWLGQLFGTSIRGEVTDGTRNEIIQASGFKAGNTASLIAAAQSVLVGTKKVRIIKHADTSWAPDMTGITNTAGPWDLLVMTLQSETLKNLLNSGLAKTLTPSVWDDYYNSVGYDPTNVYRDIIEHPDVYQQRAYAYSLRDPNWVATPTITTGFGGGPFGQTPFGYSPAVTSDLRLISQSNFPVTPTDSYQYMVSLGLGVKRNQINEVDSSIGFQFFDSSNTLVKNVGQKNYYPDPSHEYGLSPMPTTATSGSGTLALTTSQKHSGTQSIAFTNTTGDPTVYATSSDLTLTPATMNSNIGDSITCSAWVYIPNNVTPNSTILSLDGTGITGASVSSTGLPRDQWVQIKSVYTVTNATGTISFTVYSGTATNDVIYYDDFGLAVGTIPVDFNGDTTDPADGSIDYAWDGTPGASPSSALTKFFDTAITIDPTIEDTSVVSHNLVKSSKATVYAGSGTNASAINVTNFGKYQGGDVIRATINNLATTSGFGLMVTPTSGMQAIPSGTTFVFSLDFYGDADAQIDGIEVQFHDDSNSDNTAADFDYNTPAYVTTTKARWHTRHWIATVKPNRTVTSVHVIAQSSVNQGQDAYLDTANWMIEEGNVLHDYFNGYTPSDDLYTYEWDGIENYSITNKVLNSVAQENIPKIKQYATRFTAPAGAATAKVFIRVLGFDGQNVLYVAQPAVREEYDDTWVPVTADPLQAIKDKGVKPAGVILHWLPIISSWDTITANGTRTWDNLNNLTWTELEELT